MEMEMTKRNCYVTDVGNAIEALATALDSERKAPFKGDILDLLEWATKDALEMRQQLAAKDAAIEKFREAFMIAVGDKSPFAKCALAEIDKELGK
jgi:hypothetical protein